MPGSARFELFVLPAAFLARPVVKAGSRKYFQPNASFLQSPGLAVKAARLALTGIAPIAPKRLLLHKTDAVRVEKCRFLNQTAKLFGVDEVRPLGAFDCGENLLRVDRRVVVDGVDF